jgi:CRP-like cAMP-binding protein
MHANSCKIPGRWQQEAEMKPQEREKVKRRLSKGTWFRGLPENLQDAIVDRLVPRSFAKGEVIAAQGSRPKGLHVVVEGRVAWRRTTGAGNKLLLYIAGPGAWFGQLALVRGTPMQFEVEAHSAARTLLLPRSAYERLIDEDPKHYQWFADQALERFELLIRLYSEGLSLPADDLILARLATLADLRRAESGQRSGAVELTIAQADLAAMIGVSRQTLNATLKRLESDNLIEVGFRRLRIPDPARLPVPDGVRTSERPRRSMRARKDARARQ